MTPSVRNRLTTFRARECDPIAALAAVERGQWHGIGGEARRDDHGIRYRSTWEVAGTHEPLDQEICPQVDDPDVRALDEADERVDDVALPDLVLGAENVSALRQRHHRARRIPIASSSINRAARFA